MKKLPPLNSSLLSIIPFTFLPSVYGVGFGFEYQSVDTAARGNTGVAEVGSVSGVHYNPANLAWLEKTTLQSNFFGANNNQKVRRSEGTFSRDSDFTVIPTTFFAKPLKTIGHEWTLGLGLVVPYGQESRFSSNTPFSPTGFQAELKYAQLNLVAATKLTDNLAIGGGLIFSQSEVETRTTNPALSRIEGEEDDLSISWTLGLTWLPAEGHSFGINYRRGTTLDHEGTINTVVPVMDTLVGITAPSSLEFDIPDHLTVGYQWTDQEKWTLATQIQWTNWSDFDSSRLTSGGIVTEIPSDYDNGFIYGIGMNRVLSKSVSLDAGYLFAPGVAPQETLTPFTPGLDYHFFSLGVNWTKGPAVWHLSGIYSVARSRDVTNSQVNTNGKHSDNGYFINAGVTYTF